jgi:hypothetical protein
MLQVIMVLSHHTSMSFSFVYLLPPLGIHRDVQTMPSTSAFLWTQNSHKYTPDHASEIVARQNHIEISGVSCGRRAGPKAHLAKVSNPRKDGESSCYGPERVAWSEIFAYTREKRSPAISTYPLSWWRRLAMHKSRVCQTDYDDNLL